jgi:hypothetical protein
VADGDYSFAGEPPHWQPPPGMSTHWGVIPDPPD